MNLRPFSFCGMILIRKDHRNSSHYDSGDFSRAVDWLAQAQEHWGILDVVREGIWAYAKAAVNTHVATPKQLDVTA